MGVYYSLFEGLRGFYCRYSKERDSAGFSAASALSFLLGINLAGDFIISDYLLSGDLSLFSVVYRNRWSLLVLGAAILYGHVKWAKATGTYNSKETSPSSKWPRALRLYVAVTAFVFFGALACAYLASSMR